MKIAIIGAGNVGRALGRRLAVRGHEIYFGVREPQSLKYENLLEDIEEHAHLIPIQEAVTQAWVIILAVPWPAAREVIESIGDLSGKILVDVTNPLKSDLSGLEIGFETSAGETIAEWAGNAQVVKAFNSTGSKNMENPVYDSGRITMFICGDDPESNNVIARIAEDIGFEVIDAGPLHAARYLESLAMLWVHLAYNQGWGRDFAFKLISRNREYC